MNKVEVIGRLGKDIELKKSNNGKSLIEFSLADTERRNGEDVTTWINCVAWESKAENLHKYLHKGEIVYVEGKYRNDRFEINGEVRYRTYVLVTNFQLLPNPKKDEYQMSLGGSLQTAEDTERNGSIYMNEWKDLPFR